MTVMGRPPNKAPSRGFSLLELFIAVAVLAILTAAAMPSVIELGRRMTITEHTNDLVGALTAAKSEAAKRGSVAGVGLAVIAVTALRCSVVSNAPSRSSTARRRTPAPRRT